MRQRIQRRDLAAAVALSAASAWHPLPCHAARGAFELDAEYYARGLLGLPPPRPVPPSPQPRAGLDTDFERTALNLVESSAAEACGITPAVLNEEAVARFRSVALELESVGSSVRATSYSSTTPLDVQRCGCASGTRWASSGYVVCRFDVQLGAILSALSARRPSAEAISMYQTKLGTELLKQLRAPQPSCALRSDATLSASCAGARALLDRLRSLGYIRDFMLDDANVDDTLWAARGPLAVTRREPCQGPARPSVARNSLHAVARAASQSRLTTPRRSAPHSISHLHLAGG